MQVQQSIVRSEIIFTHLIWNIDEIFFSWLYFIWRKKQRVYKKSNTDYHSRRRFNHDRSRFDRHQRFEVSFESTLWNERFEFLHILFRHDDFQKSQFSKTNSWSKRLCWTDTSRLSHVRLQVVNHFHECFLLFDQSSRWLHCWQKS